jgi:hypothetical protein
MAENDNRTFEVHLIQGADGRLRLDTVGSPTSMETMGIIETFRAVLRLRALNTFSATVKVTPPDDTSSKKATKKSRRRHQMSDKGEQKYVYCFHLWPDETWGHGAAGDEHAKIPAAVFDLFRMVDHGIEKECTALEFVRFRHDVESFGITLREITRRPYYEEETVL